MNIFILLAMLFLHVIDDFFLQASWLANGKQKSWWKEVAPDPLYRYDYLAALAIHCYSWSFMVMLPIAVANRLQVGVSFLILFALNGFIHGFVDHAKANWHKINLITDQSIHILQIIVTFLILR